MASVSAETNLARGLLETPASRVSPPCPAPPDPGAVGAEAAFLHFLHSGDTWCHLVRSAPSLEVEITRQVTAGDSW